MLVKAPEYGGSDGSPPRTWGAWPRGHPVERPKRFGVDHDDRLRLMLSEGGRCRCACRAAAWVTVARATEIPPFAMLELS